MTDLAKSDNSPRPDVSGAGATQEEIRRYIRSPEDVLRLVVFATIALVLLALTVWVEDSILGFEQDIIALFGFLSPTIERVLLGSLEVGIAVVNLALLVIPLATKRYRLFGYLFAASIAAAVLMALVDALVEIWGRLRYGITPEINAIATGVLIVSLTLGVVGQRLARRGSDS